MANLSDFVLVCALASLGVSATAQAANTESIIFVGAAQPVVTFNGEKATALDADGQSLFRSSRSYVLEFAKNRDGLVSEWRPSAGIVRISRTGDPEVWLRCADLRSMVIACSKLQFDVRGGQVLRVSEPGVVAPGRSSSQVPGTQIGPSTRGVPDCPGDPRCPRF